MSEMTTMGLLELAGRCETATVGDRELDRAIELALPPYEDAKHLAFGVPMYTRSLDAAITLVPEGFERNVFDARGGVQASLESKTVLVYARAKDWPLAITAAALRARHALALSKGSDV